MNNNKYIKPIYSKKLSWIISVFCMGGLHLHFLSSTILSNYCPQNMFCDAERLKISYIVFCFPILLSLNQYALIEVIVTIAKPNVWIVRKRFPKIFSFFSLMLIICRITFFLYCTFCIRVRACINHTVWFSIRHPHCDWKVSTY